MSIEKRLSEISSSKEIFEKSKPLYEKALQESENAERMLTPIRKRKKVSIR